MTVIDVYADIVCPFAHAGLRTVVRRRKQLGRDDIVLRVRAWPLELVNGHPLERAATAEHAEEIRTQVASDLFAGFDIDSFPSTSLPALALASAAYRLDNEVGETVSLALRDALFEQGRDISDPAVLADLANAHDLGSPDLEAFDDVRAEWHQGQERGVKGSPHYFCGDVDAFCPSLDISKDETGDLQIRRNVDVLDAFLAECFKQ